MRTDAYLDTAVGQLDHTYWPPNTQPIAPLNPIPQMPSFTWPQPQFRVELCPVCKGRCQVDGRFYGKHPIRFIKKLEDLIDYPTDVDCLACQAKGYITVPGPA